MTRPINQNGLNLVKISENTLLTVYLDARDPPALTVGTGHAVRPADGLKLGDSITWEQNDAFLQHDLESALAAVDRHGLQLTENQRGALADFAFNEGAGNLDEMLRNAGTLDLVPAFLMHYLRAGRAHPPGLKTRRLRERYLWTVPDEVTVDWSQVHVE